MPLGGAWADVGCGTGVLAECILAQCEPKSVAGIDKAEGFVSAARQNITDPRATFGTGDVTALPWNDDTFDATVAGLVLNFVADHKAMASEMTRVTKPDGKVAAYVWDYGSGMEMMRNFWDAAIAVSPEDSKLDQAERFPICQPEPLQALFRDIGLRAVSCRAIDIPTVSETSMIIGLLFLENKELRQLICHRSMTVPVKRFAQIWKPSWYHRRMVQLL